jgi:hypothetical protein
MKTLNKTCTTSLSCFLAIALLTSCSDDKPSVVAVTESPAQRSYADSILTGAKIYTLNPEQTWADALAIKDGKILAVGDLTEIEQHKGDMTKVLAFDGGMILPGFHDAHTHIIYSGLEINGCPLHELSSVEAILDKLLSCAESSKDGWVVGSGWLISLFPPEGKPDKALLDKIISDRPVYVSGIDGHSGWANSMALQVAGINSETPDPEGGVIEKDPRSGEPVGTLRESAMALVESVIPARTHEDFIEAAEYGMQLSNSVGITSMIDASVGESELVAYAEVDKNNALNARLITSIEYGTNLTSSSKDFDAVVAKWKDYQGRRLKTRSIKLFIDGVLEGETAALIEPYIGKRQHHGMLNFKQDRLNAIVSKADADNIQVHMHAIGDAAVRAGLDAFEHAWKQNGYKDNRHHISHLQIIHPDDIPRFKKLDVIANFQALWAIPDDYIMKLNLPVVGQKRVDQMYPIGSMHKTGALIVGGSDWSVSSLNPLHAIHVGVNREDPGGVTIGVLTPGERVDLKTMIEAYTINGAFVMHQEDVTGSIEVGKLADLVVLDNNLFEIPVKEIYKAKVLHTFLEGEKIYSAE